MWLKAKCVFHNNMQSQNCGWAPDPVITTVTNYGVLIKPGIGNEEMGNEEMEK